MSSQEGKLRVVPRLLTTAIFFAAFETVVFHSGLYAYIVEPDSAAGFSENRLRNEILRPKLGGIQVLAVGNSRMGFLPHIANPMRMGCEFGSIAVPGTSPRCWYYQLRYLDPEARCYAAVVIPCEDYDDPELYPDARDTDFSFLLPRLGQRDLIEFPHSFRDRKLQWTAFRTILLKGYGYRRDFQAFLSHPVDRLAKVELFKVGSATWYYDYEPTDERVTEQQRQTIAASFGRSRAPDTGRGTAYFRHWYGRIVDHYRGARTKIVFVRLPRGPVSPPEYPPKPDSAVRQLASRRNVIVLHEHFFDSLESPEFFFDAMHLNRKGSERFTTMLATEVARVLAPPGT